MKNFIKFIFRVLFRLCVFPFYLFYLLSNLFLDKEKNFQGYSQLFSLIPGLIGEYLRREFYRLTLTYCSNDCCISFGVLFSSYQASVGEGVYIGPYCMIGNVDIGKDTLIGTHSEIINGGKQHYADRLDIPIREQGGEFPKVVIGEDCWIGDGAIVMSNVGMKSIIGARSLVHKPIAEYSIAAGSPARVIRKRQ